MCCCCGGRMCMLCTCLILVVILIGLFFGFGVFKDGFHKIRETIHNDTHPIFVANLYAGTGRRTYGFPAPPGRF